MPSQETSWKLQASSSYVPEVDAIEHMFLELYLALVLMTTDFTKLAPVAGQMGIVLVAQAILMALFGIFVSFNLFGRDYGAAVMTAGNYRLGLRFRSERSSKRESRYGSVWMAHRCLGSVSVLRSYHRRYLQPDFPFHLLQPDYKIITETR
ncbi:MAG: sodium/glutamate symporter [Clostridium fessum]